MPLKVHVETAPWAAVDRIRVLRAAAAPSKVLLDEPLSLKPSASGALTADLSRSIVLDRDDAVVIVVTGSGTLEPVLSGPAGEIHPFAMTGATWVDANGDGQALGRMPGKGLGRHKPR